MSELLGVGMTATTEGIKAVLSKRKRDKEELEKSQIFVEVEQINGLSPDAHELNPDHPRIYKCSPDQHSSETAASTFLKISNSSDEIIRNAEITIYSIHNYGQFCIEGG